MADFLGVNISGLLAENLGPLVLPVTLIVVTAGTRNPADSTGGTNPTESSIDGRGFVDDYNDNQIDNTLIRRGDRRVTLIADTFPGSPVPQTGDKITIEGATYNILRVRRDPAAATYTCQVRS